MFSKYYLQCFIELNSAFGINKDRRLSGNFITRLFSDPFRGPVQTQERRLVDAL